MLLAKRTSRELAGEVFDAIKSDCFTSIATIDAELTGKLVRRRHLYSLLWLFSRRYEKREGLGLRPEHHE